MGRKESNQTNKNSTFHMIWLRYEQTLLKENNNSLPMVMQVLSVPNGKDGHRHYTPSWDQLPSYLGQCNHRHHSEYSAITFGNWTATIGLNHGQFYMKRLESVLQKRKGNHLSFFIYLNQNICCGYSKEPSQGDGSFEHPKHTFAPMEEKICILLPSSVCWTGPMWNNRTYYDVIGTKTSNEWDVCLSP